MQNRICHNKEFLNAFVIKLMWLLTTPCIFEGEGSDSKEREIDRQTEIKPSWEVYQKEDVIFIASQF